MRISDWSSDVCSSDLLDALPRAKMDTAIRQALIKNDSIASQLDLSFAGAGKPKTIRIKLEIDVNPPAGSGEASSYLDFPADHEVRHQDLPSNFALKIHALLCRGFLKGDRKSTRMNSSH